MDSQAYVAGDFNCSRYVVTQQTKYKEFPCRYQFTVLGGEG